MTEQARSTVGDTKRALSSVTGVDPASIAHYVIAMDTGEDVVLDYCCDDTSQASRLFTAAGRLVVTAGDGPDPARLDTAVPVRFPAPLAEAARAAAASEGRNVSEWVRNLIAAELARRDGKVTVSRADLDQVLACFDPRTEYAGNARDRLLAEMGPT